MGFIDPHRTTVKAAETSPAGVKKKIAEVMRHSGHAATFHGIFGVDSKEQIYDATLFRFPLRRVGHNSKISSNVNTVEHVKDTHFESFKSEAPFILLFLKNVISISLYDMDEFDDKPQLIFSVKVDANCQAKLQHERKLCSKEAEKFPDNSKSFVQIYTTTITINDRSINTIKQYHWLVLNYLGSTNDGINALGKKLSILPWVGLAAQMPVPVDVAYEGFDLENHVDDVLCKFRQCNSKVDLQSVGKYKVSKSGRAFCFLPLPINTSLPVHVHGYFAVSDNRRSIKWPEHDEKGPEAIWNQTLVREMLASAYSILLPSRCALYSYPHLDYDELSKSELLKDVYSLWPSYSEIKNNPMCMEMLPSVLSSIKDSPVLWSTVGTWVCFNEAYFVLHDGHCPAVVVTALLNNNLPVVVFPEDVNGTITTSSDLSGILKSRAVSPHVLRKFFPSNHSYSSSDIDTLLEYVLSDLSSSNSGELIGIPLLPLQDGSCIRFKGEEMSDRKYLLTSGLKHKYDDNFLPGISELVVKTSIPDKLNHLMKKVAIGRYTQVKLADNADVCAHLLYASILSWLPLVSNESKTSFEWCPGKRGHPDKSWLEKVWNWIETEDIDLNDLNDLPLVPLKLKPNSSPVLTRFKSIGVNFCYIPSVKNQLHLIFEQLGFVLIDESLINVSSFSTIFPLLTQKYVLSKLAPVPVSSLASLTSKEKDLLCAYFSECGYVKDRIQCLRKFPIFREGVFSSSQCYLSLDDPVSPFIPPAKISWKPNLRYPRGMLYNEDPKTVRLLKNLQVKQIKFSDFCTDYWIPLSKTLIQEQKAGGDDIILFILSYLNLQSEDSFRILNHLSKSEIFLTKALSYKLAKNLYYSEGDEFEVLFNSASDVTPHDKYKDFIHFLREMGLRDWRSLKNDRSHLMSVLTESLESTSNITPQKYPSEKKR